MKKLSILLILCVGFIMAGRGEDSTKIATSIWPEKKPKFQVTVHTLQNQKIKGLLIDVNDSTLILFPGRVDEWKNRDRIQPLYLADSSIEFIKVKNKNAAGTGALTGLAIGLTPILAAVADPVNAQAYGMVAILTIPVGIITGALIGGGSYKKFKVNGNREAFLVFKNKIKK